MMVSFFECAATLSSFQNYLITFFFKPFVKILKIHRTDRTQICKFIYKIDCFSLLNVYGYPSVIKNIKEILSRNVFLKMFGEMKQSTIKKILFH